MLAFLVQRLFQAVLVMLAVAVIAFALFNYVGDPISSMVGQDTSVADRERLRQELGLDDSFIVQFARFVGRAARGDFGLSYQQARPVGQIILEKMPATLELSFVAATLALTIGVPMGIYTGLHRDTWLSQLLLALSLVGVSLPTFLIGILLILVFAVLLGWLPSFGRGTVVHIGWWTTGFLTAEGWRAIILPAITLALFQMTLIMRLVRAEMIEVLRTDYIKFARARGLPVEVAAFEAWDPDDRRFDTVIAAQSWHWVDPLTGAAKAARVLRPTGRLAIFGHVFEPPAEWAKPFAAAYRRVVPDSPFANLPPRRPLDMYQAMYAKFAGTIRETGQFSEPEQWRFDWEQSYTRDQWLALLPTTGGLTRLRPDRLADILDEVGTAIDALGGAFTMHYTTLAVSAARVSTP